MTPSELHERIDAALANEDLEALDALRGAFADGGEASLPFQPAVRLRDADADAFEGDGAIWLANSLSRAIRKIKYRRKRRSGYSGPIIVSEGDSWFQYPIVLKDVIDNLMESYAVFSLGAAGDTQADMIASGDYRDAIAEEGADVFLFSASGNDVLGGGSLADMLYDYSPGMAARDVVRQDSLARTLDAIEDGHATVIDQALAINQRLAVLFHGYDKPVPRRDGRWLGKPMTSRGIPAFLQAEVTGYLIDRLNERLKPLDSFILPGGSPAAAHLHMARALVRRAERSATALAVEETLNPAAIKYLNRLSDLFFQMARAANDDGATDVLWAPGANR